MSGPTQAPAGGLTPAELAAPVGQLSFPAMQLAMVQILAALNLEPGQGVGDIIAAMRGRTREYPLVDGAHQALDRARRAERGLVELWAGIGGDAALARLVLIGDLVNDLREGGIL